MAENRAERFRQWVVDLTPEKVKLLSELEKSARLLKHVHDLTGDADPKLVTGVMAAGQAIREAYENQ